MMLGVFFGQYFINTITRFFLTVPDLSGAGKRHVDSESGSGRLDSSTVWFCGRRAGRCLLGLSDQTRFIPDPARKLPIVLGMLLASTIILCNYTNNTTLVVMLMALAFFGKGFGALGWPVISDTAPKEIVGLCGGVFNVFGNVASIVTHW